MMGTIIRNRTTTPALRTRRMRYLTGALGLSGLAALTVCAAPAQATATRVGAEPGISFGMASNFGTGCAYTINGYVDDPTTPVVFYDNGIPFAWSAPSGWLAQAPWTPATPGPHRIQAVQHSQPGPDVFPYVDVHVGMGLSSGSGCLVIN
ncbi:hypothetical protein ACIP5Y_05965 [Nocardia sp. NPDC088792]|uniref:hypothetical protein n=1 Tax=Nocardia sp. NPDC088792 TaxID=3364332 RepID=UPI0037F2DF14